MRVCFVRLLKFEKRENEEVNGSFRERVKSIENFLKNFLCWVRSKIYFYLNFVKKDKFSDVVLVSNFNEKSVRKLDKILQKEGYDFAITENDEDINFPSLDEKMLTKFLLLEIKNYVFDRLKPSLDEVYICVNEYNNENMEIIMDLINSSKNVNIITENQLYYYWEEQMEKKEIYFNVTSNKRKSLKKANFIINLDYKSLNGFNINRNAIIVDTTSNMQLPQGFEGIVIKKCKINTKKVLRIFSEFPEFNREKLLIYELLKERKISFENSLTQNNKNLWIKKENNNFKNEAEDRDKIEAKNKTSQINYLNVRNKILQDKIFIEGIYNKRKIENTELKSLQPSTLKNY